MSGKQKQARNTNKSSITKGKSKQYKVCLQQVYEAFYKRPLTMKEVDKSIGIMRESVCRYVDMLRKKKQIVAVKKRRCTITGHPKVIEWTTNPKFFPSNNQLYFQLT